MSAGRTVASARTEAAPAPRRRRRAAGFAAAAPALAGGWRLPMTVFAACFALAAFTTAGVLSTDTYLDLYAGRLIDADGLPRVDSLTAAGHGRAWVDQQWLAHWLVYRVWSLGGDALLSCLGAALVATAFALLALLVRAYGARGWGAGVAIAVASVAILPDAGIWAQSFAYPLFAALLLVLLHPRWRGRTGALVAALALLLLWADVHGSVLVGVAVSMWLGGTRLLAALRARGRPPDIVRPAALVLLAPFAALCTPYGPVATLHYFRAVLLDPAMREELYLWQPASPESVRTWAYLAILAAAAALVARARRRGRPPDLALLCLAGGCGVAGLYAVRYQVWSLLVWLPVVARACAGPVPRPASAGLERRRRLGAAAALALALAAVVHLATADASSFERFSAPGAVQAAKRWSAQHPASRILADTVTSAPLLWHAPELAGRVAFDPRIEVFRPADVRAWFDVQLARGPAWRRQLRGDDVVVVSRSAHPRLAAALVALDGWLVVYDRADGVVAVRR